jgi:hypothetical protein
MPPPPGARVSPQRRGRRHFFRTFSGVLTLLLALAIIGSALLFGATRYFQLESLLPKPAKTTVAPLPTVAPKPGYTIYANKALGFSLQYTDSWQKQSDKDTRDPEYQSDLFTAGRYTGLEVGSSPRYANMSPGQIDDYILANPFPLDGEVANVQVFVPVSPTIRIANQDWTTEDADITLTNGVSIRVACLAIIHNGRGYAIFYFASQGVFSTTYNHYFQPMLLSFRFP